MQERRFQMVEFIYGGLQFPNPETSWHSSLADVENTNNITGFKNARVDEICSLYDKMFSVEERIRAVREVDGIVTNAYHHTLFWTAPYFRVIYWNRYGMPSGLVSRTGDAASIPIMWWIDPDKEIKLQQALKDSSMKLEVGATDDKYWIEYEKNQPASSSTMRRVQ
jgi:microcin C transport system substrate-binding protein